MAFRFLSPIAAVFQASPFGSNGDDRRQWRKQGGAVGAAASRMRAVAKQTLGAATRAVACRRRDGEGKPGTLGPPHSDEQTLLPEQYYRCAFASPSAPLPSQALRASSPRGGASGVPVSFRLNKQSTMSREQKCSAVQGSGSLTRCVVQKLLPSVARPALLRHIGPRASSRKWPGLPMAPLLGATTTTAASGGSRESLLGPRPARRKRSAADAGCRNPALSAKQTERFYR